MTLLTSLGMPSFAEKQRTPAHHGTRTRSPAQHQSTEATFVAGMESAHDEEMLQATAPPLLMNDPKPL